MNKNFLSIILVVTFLLRLTAPVLVYAAPELPSLPQTPSESEQPDQADLPSNFQSPNPTATPISTPKPTPEVASTPVPANATPTASPSPEVQLLESIASPTSSLNQIISDQLGGNVEIKTGDVAATGGIQNSGNENMATIEGPESSLATPPSGSINISNEDNLQGSTNSATVNEDNATTIIQDNNASLDNNLNIDVNSGDNVASNNLASTSITSGDAFVSGTIVNMINTNAIGAKIAEFNILDDQRGDYILDFDAGCIIGCSLEGIGIDNTSNGPGSLNLGEVNVDDSSEIFQNNDANVENNMVLVANTGNNTLEDNIGKNHAISTGDATVSASVLNFLNNNFYGDVMLGVVNIFGDFIGDILIPDELLAQFSGGVGLTDTNLSNTGNGSQSTNTASYNQSSLDQYNQNNDANILNNIKVDAISGDNNISDNLGSSHDVTTGDTNVDVNLLNIANNNFIGNNWWFVIVNEAGNWIGKLIALPGASVAGNMAAIQGTNLSESGNGNVDIVNQGNAEGSTNSGSVNQTSENIIGQTNNAQIVNNIDLLANTGGNNISKNLGDATIVTGDANAMVNVINFVNNNFIGSNVFVTIVNVFGSWIGDFITPGAQKPILAKEIDAPVQQASQVGEPARGGSDLHFGSSDNAVAITPANTPVSLSGFSRTSVVGSYQLSTNSKVVNSYKDDQKVLAYADTAVGNSSTSNENKKIKINLAWLLPIGFMGLVGFLIKKRLN